LNGPPDKPGSCPGWTRLTLKIKGFDGRQGLSGVFPIAMRQSPPAVKEHVSVEAGNNSLAGEGIEDRLPTISLVSSGCRSMRGSKRSKRNSLRTSRPKRGGNSTRRPKPSGGASTSESRHLSGARRVSSPNYRSFRNRRASPRGKSRRQPESFRLSCGRMRSRARRARRIQPFCRVRQFRLRDRSPGIMENEPPGASGLPSPAAIPARTAPHAT